MLNKEERILKIEKKMKVCNGIVNGLNKFCNNMVINSSLD